MLPGPGFLPVRQLVLVDLLSMMVGIRPGERAVVAVAGPDGTGRVQLVGELVALAPHVAGREVLSVGHAGRGAAAGERSADDENFRRTLLQPFRAGLELRPGAGHEQREAVEPASDALLIVEGSHLRRPEMAREWDATCLLITETPTEGLDDAYLQRARLLQPTWIVDVTDQHRPELVEPDPEEPQWF